MVMVVFRFAKKLAKKMLVLGLGDYNVKNVAKCWVYETALLCDVEIDIVRPREDIYKNYFGD